MFGSICAMLIIRITRFIFIEVHLMDDDDTLVLTEQERDKILRELPAEEKNDEDEDDD